ncbi:hypothetical protein [Micromonospora sp. CPCC 206061]|uniref:hypothetical protein n=1 Tax=Micromonospora sp. CPCC 206061 TaxID=3122410 RepID=UPI002FF43C08
MTMFSRRRQAAPAAVDEEGERDAQFAAIEVADGFHDHDTAALAALSAHQRADQVAARRALFDYVDAMWDGAKAKGLSPADLPEYAVVAGMRDLTAELLATAEQAQHDAGDEP